MLGLKKDDQETTLPEGDKEETSKQNQIWSGE